MADTDFTFQNVLLLHSESFIWVKELNIQNKIIKMRFFFLLEEIYLYLFFFCEISQHNATQTDLAAAASPPAEAAVDRRRWDCNSR